MVSDLTRFSKDENESPFDSIRHYDANGNEFWYGRELMPLLDYKNWQPFGGSRNDRLSVIQKSQISCENSGGDSKNHFSQVTKQVKRSNNGIHYLDDWKLSRFACYLIAQNGDPTKQAIANAQAYFAIKTRQAELQEAPKPKTAIEMAKETLRLAQQNLELLEEIERQQLMIGDLEDQNLYLSEMADELFNYSSIIRVAKFNNVSEKEFSWHRLKATSKQLDVEIKQAPCPRYGYKNIYSHTAWRKAYPNVRLPEDSSLTVA